MKFIFYLNKFLTDLRDKPRWIVMFIVLASLNVLIEVVRHPHSVEVLLEHLPVSATEHDKITIMETLDKELATRLAFLPIRLLVGWSAYALCLFYICYLLKPLRPVRFIQIFSLEVYAEIFPLLGKLIALLLIVLKSGTQYSIPFSLASIFNTQNYTVFTLLNVFNIFNLCYFVFLFIGVSLFVDFNKQKSILIVLCVWVIWLLFNLSIITVLAENLSLLL